MNKFRYIGESINVLNCILILIVAAVAYEVLTPFFAVKIQPVLPSVGRMEMVPAENQNSLSYPSPANYNAVAEQNLFHPERRMPPEKKVEREVAVAVAVIPKPDLVLYGTLITDTLSVAYVEDRKAPYSTPGRGSRQRQLKKGDNVNGYILQEIAPDRIVLVRDSEKLIVALNDKNKIRVSEGTAPVTLGSLSGSAAPSRSVPSAPASAGSRTAVVGQSRGRAGLSPGTGSPGYFPVTAAPIPATASPTSAIQPSTSSSSSNSPVTTAPASPVLPGTSPTGTTDNPVSDPSSAQPQIPTPPPGVAQMIDKLPPRSHALSDMLNATPEVVRKMMEGN